METFKGLNYFWKAQHIKSLSVLSLFGYMTAGLAEESVGPGQLLPQGMIAVISTRILQNVQIITTTANR